MRGLICEVYMSELGSMSNGGISTRHKEVLLIGPEVKGYFDSMDLPNIPTVTLKKVLDCSSKTNMPVFVAVPCDPETAEPDTSHHYMAGGCFIYTSDSRFPFDGPIKLHDRVEY